MTVTTVVPPSPFAVMDMSLLAGSMCNPWKNTFVSLALRSNDDDDDDDEEEEEEEVWCVLAARLFFRFIVITSPGSTNKVGPGTAHTSL